MNKENCTKLGTADSTKPLKTSNLKPHPTSPNRDLKPANCDLAGILKLLRNMLHWHFAELGRYIQIDASFQNPWASSLWIHSKFALHIRMHVHRRIRALWDVCVWWRCIGARCIVGLHLQSWFLVLALALGYVMGLAYMVETYRRTQRNF